MLAVTRRNMISEILVREKSINILELAEQFDVTSQTIRRDLEILEKQGVLTRTHGGAYIKEGIVSNVNIALRKNMLQDGKITIAKQCIDLIKNGDSIFLDNSSTALAVAKELPNISIKVITNSLLVSSHVAKLKNIDLITIGGSLNKVNMCYVGKAAADMLSGYFMDKAFVSSSTLNMRHGITDSNEDVAAIRSIAINHAIKNYLIVDHTKFDKTSLVSVGNFNQFKGIITDKQPSDEWKEFLSHKNIRIYWDADGYTT